MWWIVLHKLEDDGELLIYSESFESFEECLECHQRVFPTGELWVVTDYPGDRYQVYDSSCVGFPVFAINHFGKVIV